MAGWQTDERIFTTQKIKQGFRLVLCEMAYSMSTHFFTALSKTSFKRLNVLWARI